MAEVAGQGMGGDGLQVRQCHAVIDVVTEKEFDTMSVAESKCRRQFLIVFCFSHTNFSHT